jgi:hypothetical protein
MHIEFKKAVQFSLLIKTGGRLREFNFRKLNNVEGELLSVNVCNERGDRIMFTMLKTSDSEWEINDDRLPKWILDDKNNIRNAVEEELKNWH